MGQLLLMLRQDGVPPRAVKELRVDSILLQAGAKKHKEVNENTSTSPGKVSVVANSVQRRWRVQRSSTRQARLCWTFVPPCLRALARSLRPCRGGQT